MTNATSPADAWYDERSSTLSIANPPLSPSRATRRRRSPTPGSRPQPRVLELRSTQRAAAEHDVLGAGTTAQIEVLDAPSNHARAMTCRGRITSYRGRRRRHRPEFGRAAPVASRSISVSRATRAESACRLRQCAGVAARPRRNEPVSAAGKNRFNAPSESTAAGSGLDPFSPQPDRSCRRVHDGVRAADARRVDLDDTVRDRRAHDAESMATVSIVEVASVAPSAARIVAGLNPGPARTRSP
jgi:hypothetical protein